MAFASPCALASDSATRCSTALLAPSAFFLLEGAAADAVGARVGPLHEECVGLQTEDVVDDPHEVVGHLEQHAETSDDHFRSARRCESEGPVVDELDIRCECRRVAIIAGQQPGQIELQGGRKLRRCARRAAGVQ